MGDWTKAQERARAAFRCAKESVRIMRWPPKSYAARQAFAVMRNAVVAYHAGASWTSPDRSAYWQAMAEQMGASNARLRAEADRHKALADEVCTLLFESSQDGMDIGSDCGSSWQGIEGARRWAEYIKNVMRRADDYVSRAFPDEDPEVLSGPYGDGFDAMLSALSALTEERDEARAEVERLRSGIRDIAGHLRDSGRVQQRIVPCRASFADMLDALAQGEPK